MIIRVVKDKHNPYVMMNKAGLNDPRLSFKAKGILAYLLSKPDDWKVRVKDLANHAADGTSAVRSGLQELIDYGYATYERKRNGKGEYATGEYTIFEVPRCENPNVDNPNEDNRSCTNNDVVPSNDVTKSAADAATSKHPAIKAFRENANRYPSKSWYQDVVDAVGRDPPDVELWGQVVKAYVGLGWNPTNVKVMLEYYARREIPSTNSGPRRKKSNLERSLENAGLAEGSSPDGRI